MKSCPSCHAETDDGARFCLECGFAFEASGPEPADPWQGRMVAGRFRIVRKLGDGGMGEVFLAEQVPMGRSVALKVLRQSLSDDPEQVARFKREAQAASQLQHPNTIIVHDFGQDEDGTLFIAMEFLEGHPLDAVLEEQGTLEPERAARIMAQVCASLNEAHARHMVHRDLKPENIFLVERGTPDFVKVLDFGIAKVTQSSSGEKLESITRAGAVFGTPHYMAPEQIRGEELDARADVYALGVVLYRMIAGHLPFEASTVMEMLTKHLTAEPAPIQRDGGRGEPAARARLEAVALRALSKQRDQRQPSALAFMEDIMAALPGVTFNSITGLTPLAAGTGAVDIALDPPIVDEAPPSEGGGKGLLIALVVLLLAGGAGAAWWFLGQNGGGAGGAGGTPAIVGQAPEGGGDEGGGAEPGDEKPADGEEKPADGEEKPEDGEEKPADGEEQPEAGGEQANGAPAAGGEGGEGGEAGAGGEAAEGAAGEQIDEAEAKRVAAEAAAEEAAAAKEQAAAEAEKAKVAAEEKARAAAAEKQAADAAKAKAESDKAEAEAARAKAEADKAAAEEAAAAAEAKAQQATAGRKQAEAAAAMARAKRLKAEAAAARAKADAERMRAEMVRLEAAKVAAEQARIEAETAREAAEARALEAETKKAEAAAKKKAAKKGRRAASYGSVQITTRSTKAKVRIDGRAAALTPLSRPIKLKPGRHHIEVVKDGKRMSKTITVQAGKVSRVSFSL